MTWPTLLLVFFAGWAVGIWNAEWIRDRKYPRSDRSMSGDQVDRRLRRVLRKF